MRHNLKHIAEYPYSACLRAAEQIVKEYNHRIHVNTMKLIIKNR
jgi:hypothetical protein